MATPRRSPANDANPHDFIEFSIGLIQDVFAISAPLYKKGLSLREIALRTGFSKTHIRKELLRGGVSLRESSRGTGGSDWRNFGKKSVKPPYGFCYLEGRIQKHPEEYPVLHLIHERWKAGYSLNSIACWLNKKRIPSPMKKDWSWNSVTNIIERFKNNTIVKRGNNYELR